MKLDQLSEALHAPFENGSPDTEITGVAGLEDAAKPDLKHLHGPQNT